MCLPFESFKVAVFKSVALGIIYGSWLSELPKVWSQRGRFVFSSIQEKRGEISVGIPQQMHVQKL